MRAISVIMVSYENCQYYKEAIKRLKAHIKDIELEFIVVDNNSQNPTLKQFLSVLESESDTKVVRLAKNGGYSTAVNVGATYAKNEFVLIFDNDVFVEENANEHFVKMYDILKNSLEYGLISPLFIKEDGTPDINYFIDFNILNMLYERFSRIFSDKSKYKSLSKLDSLPKDKNGCIHVEYIAGQFFLMRKNVLLDLLGGWDIKYFLGVSDTDLCEKINFYGLKNMIYPDLKLIHGGSKVNSHESVRLLVLYENFKTFAYFLLKWKIFPLFRDMFYKIFFMPFAWMEYMFRKINKNQNAAD